jgi:hypothetical protein
MLVRLHLAAPDGDLLGVGAGEGDRRALCLGLLLERVDLALGGPHSSARRVQVLRRGDAHP